MRLPDACDRGRVARHRLAAGSRSAQVVRSVANAFSSVMPGSGSLGRLSDRRSAVAAAPTGGHAPVTGIPMSPALFRAAAALVRHNLWHGAILRPTLSRRY